MKRLETIKKIGSVELPERENRDYFTNSKLVCEISPQHFDKKVTYEMSGTLKKAPSTRKKSPSVGGCVMVLFYAPWCGFCKQAKDIWEEFAKTAGFLDVCAFNCEKYKDHLHKMNMDFERKNGERLVPHFPTIVLYKGGKFAKKFEGDRSVDNFLKFAMENSCRV